MATDVAVGTASPDKSGVIALPPLLYAGAFLVALVLRWLMPLPIARWAIALPSGVLLSVVAVAIARWGRRTMQAAGTNINPGLPATTVVMSGPFRYSRNPLYIALTLLYLGLTLAVNTWWGIIALVPLLITMHVGVVLREERYLERKFGDEYRDYRSRVRRYV
jgi:protein-S-isoprenylcysteine O-methyltransferase Ste14